MNYYKSAYYSYQPTTTHSIYYQDYQTQQQQRGYGQRTSDPRRNQHPSLISGYSQSSFDSPSSYLSTPKDLFGYENQNSSTKLSSGAGADAGSTANQGESISGMLSNFSKVVQQFHSSYTAIAQQLLINCSGTAQKLLSNCSTNVCQWGAII